MERVQFKLIKEHMAAAAQGDDGDTVVNPAVRAGAHPGVASAGRDNSDLGGGAVSKHWIEKQAMRLWECHGYKCAVVQAPLYGAINGYVQIPPTHPDYGKSYSDLDLDCHGGLTYGKPDDEGWYGFDTLHAWDWWPGMGEGPFLKLRGPEDREWDQEDVEREVEKLAAEFAERERGHADE